MRIAQLPDELKSFRDNCEMEIDIFSTDKRAMFYKMCANLYVNDSPLLVLVRVNRGKTLAAFMKMHHAQNMELFEILE